MDLEDTLSVKEACAYLHVSSKTIYRWIESGKLPAQKVGLQYFIKRDMVEAVASGRGVYIDNIVQRIDNLEQRLTELERTAQSSPQPHAAQPPPTPRSEQVKPPVAHPGAIMPEGTITLQELSERVQRSKGALLGHLKKYDQEPEKYPQFEHIRIPVLARPGWFTRYFTEEQAERITVWIAANTNKGSGPGDD
jgi:excisionase family DNA binding protein